MTGAIFILTILLAGAFGFLRYSEAEFTQTHEAEIVQLSVVALCVLFVLYAIFSQSFLLFCLEVAGCTLGLGAGRLGAGAYEKYSEDEDASKRMRDSAY